MIESWWNASLFAEVRSSSKERHRFCCRLSNILARVTSSAIQCKQVKRKRFFWRKRGEKRLGICDERSKCITFAWCEFIIRRSKWRIVRQATTRRIQICKWRIIFCGGSFRWRHIFGRTMTLHTSNLHKEFAALRDISFRKFCVIGNRRAQFDCFARIRTRRNFLSILRRSLPFNSEVGVAGSLKIGNENFVRTSCQHQRRFFPVSAVDSRTFNKHIAINRK